MADIESNKKICVVGGGRWGQNHIRTLYEMGNLGAIVESNPKRLEELKLKYKNVKCYLCLENSLNADYDGYVIATPAQTHYELGRILLKDFKNVLIEKPLTLTSREAKKLVKLAEKNKCKLMVGHLLLFHPAIIKIKEVINKGKIGKVLYIYSTRLNYGIVRSHENVFSSFASHDISVFNYIIGQPPTNVETGGSSLLQKNIHDAVMTSLIYPQNIKGYIFVSWLFPFKEQRLVIVGENGMLSFEDASTDKKLYLYDKKIILKDGIAIKEEGKTETIEYKPSAPLRNELEYFINNLDEGLTIDINSGQRGYEVVNVLEKVNHKLKRRRG